MKYIHSLLTISHHQLKANRKFNMNFNLNMKYDRVRGKQKILNFNIPTPPIASHPPLLLPTPWPPACPLFPYAFVITASGNFKKLKRKEKCFLRFRKKWFLHRKIWEFCDKFMQLLLHTAKNPLTHNYKQLGLWLVSTNYEMMQNRWKYLWVWMLWISYCHFGKEPKNTIQTMQKHFYCLPNYE